MALKTEIFLNRFNQITQRYFVNRGRANRICRTNGWYISKQQRTRKDRAYDVFQKSDGYFLGHYEPGKLYIIHE